MKHKLIHKIAYIFFILVCFLNSFLTVFAAGAYSDLEAGTYTATIENFANSGKTQTFQMVLIPDINGYLYLDREKTNIPIKDSSGDKDYLPDELTYKNANGKEVTFDLRSTSRIDNTSGAIKVDGKGNLTSPTITQTETKPVVTLGATTPPPNSNAGSYTFLAPLPFFGGPSINIAEGGLAGYLDGLYKAGVAVATGLALIMIVAGGLEYASAGSVGGKEGGKSKIKNALIGLLLALTSFIILQQINPGLIRNDLNVTATKAVGGITGQAVDLVDYTNTTLGNLPNTQGIIDGSLGNNPGSFPGSGVLSTSAVAARIVQSARANLNKSTCFPVTEYGRRGCGYAFGKIMSTAGVTFTNLNSSSVLSTSNIYSVLATDQRFALVAINDTRNTLPGDIIISPTTPVATGHVGIIEQAGAGKIISNSSSAGSIQDYFTGQKWLNYYGGKGLKTYIFRYR